jgi:hypothetical protein
MARLLFSSIMFLTLLIPFNAYGADFNYDESKSLADNVLDNCASSPGWLTSLKSLVQMSPTKEKCDEAMIALYKFCYTSVGFLDGIANAFGRTIEPGSLGGNVKEKCSDERLLNYEYPEWFKNIIEERNLNQGLINK